MNKTAFITGATRGIGKQIAITLAKEGFSIAMNYRSENEELEKAKQEILALGVECMAVKADVSDFTQVEEAVKQIIEKWGKIDVLVNNAGITKDRIMYENERRRLQTSIRY